MIYIQGAWGHIVKDQAGRVDGRGGWTVRKMEIDGG